MSSTPGQTTTGMILCKDIKGHMGTHPLLISRMPYSICSLEEDAAPSVIIKGKRCYPAYDDGIDQTCIPYQLAMFHAINIDYRYSDDGWMGGISGSIDLYDTPEHTSLYGRNGYGNCGGVMYTNNYTIDMFDAYNGTETDFSTYGDILKPEYIDKFNDTVEVELGINENNELTARASERITADISVSGTLDSHIRCVSVQDPFNTIWGHYFTHEEKFSCNHTSVISTEPTPIDKGTIAESFASLRNYEYYSVIDAWDVDEFRNPKTTAGTVREYLKPEGMQIVVSMSTPNDRPIAITFSGTLKYDYKTSSPVSWPTGSGYRQIVPSSYSGYDSRLDDDGCPPGSTFTAELLSLQPKVIFNKNQDLYFIPQL